MQSYPRNVLSSQQSDSFVLMEIQHKSIPKCVFVVP